MRGTPIYMKQFPKEEPASSASEPWTAARIQGWNGGVAVEGGLGQRAVLPVWLDGGHVQPWMRGHGAPS